VPRYCGSCEQAESQADLIDKLRGARFWGIIFTTIQKFSSAGVLCDQRNIVVVPMTPPLSVISLMAMPAHA
jgi:type I site-specific restriction-modification system R (restriction) subunit